MARRDIDTELKKQRWFRQLTQSQKLAYIYAWLDCDWGGVWTIDLDLFHIFNNHTELQLSEFVAACNGQPSTELKMHTPAPNAVERVRRLDDHHLWLVGYVTFQIPNGLQPTNRAHGPTFASLRRWRLLDEVQAQYATLGVPGDDELPTTSPATKEASELALLAHAACGRTLHFPDSVTLNNVMRLLQQGTSADEIRALCAWRTGTASPYKPKSAANLTDTKDYEKWLTMMHDEQSPASRAKTEKREAWQIEKEIETVRAMRKKAVASCPFGTSPDSIKKREAWHKSKDGIEAAKLKTTLEKLERELRDAIDHDNKQP